MLGKHYYNKVLIKSVAAFGTVFNNLKIKNSHTNEERRVPIAYGPKAKWLYRLENDPDLTDGDVGLVLPRMAFTITSWTYDSTNKKNRLNKFRSDVEGTELEKNITRQSVAYDLGFQLNIIGKTQDDVSQIVEQILPTFQPEYTVSVIDFDGPGRNVDVPIILQGVSMVDEWEGDFSSYRSIIYTLDFTMKVRLHGLVENQKVIRISEALLYDSTIEGVTDQAALSGYKAEVGLNDTPDNYTITETFGFTG